tara:strand:+ start:710 stop:1534 length:825 start_codon:yes stop_codon:yes gene_type:complete
MQINTYSQHYDLCRQEYKKDDYIGSHTYNNVHDLRMDQTFLDGIIDDKKYASLVKNIAEKTSYKFDNNIGVFQSNLYDLIKDTNDIAEIQELADYIMPLIEQEIFHSYLKVEFVQVYRNRHDSEELTSFLWHYDDSPAEFLKFAIYLNDVNENSGCLQYLTSKTNEIYKYPSSRGGPYMRSQGKVYPSSRIPPDVVENTIKEGGKINNLVGSIGTYAIFTPNISHRGTKPHKNAVPRDCIMFLIRPSLKKQKTYINKRTPSIVGAKNTKIYFLD